MDTTKNPMPPEFDQAARDLAESLAASEPFILYFTAGERLESSPEALDLLERFSAAQADLRQRQGSGDMKQSDVDHGRKLQGEVQANPVIMEFAQTQQAAVQLLREVNQEISQQIGFDFASLARRSCH